jgi:hypothetical protein
VQSSGTQVAPSPWKASPRAAEARPISCEPLLVKKDTALPGAFGLSSSRFKKREGLPAFPASTTVFTAATMPPLGAL